MTDEAHLIPGLSAESKVHVYGVHEGKLSEEDARRVQARRDAAADAIRSAASMGGGVPVRTAGLWTQIEKPPGYVTVELPAAEHPIILVLAAAKSVNWTVDPAPGARIEHVILSGQAEQLVSGVRDDVPVTAFSSVTGNRLKFYAYKKQDGNYRKLVHEIQRLTDKPIHQFRGAYEGDVFRAGYRKEMAVQATLEDSVPQTVTREQQNDDAPAPATEEPSDDVAPPPATRKIHKWVDESGRTHYGDRAPGTN